MAAHTYVTGIDPLQPLASGVDDNPAAGIAAGDVMSSQHVIDARIQHQTRKHFFQAGNQTATDDEVVNSKRRKHQVESANFDGAAPLWGQQMQHQMQQMQHQMQQMQHQMQQMQETLERKITIESERNMNRSRRSTSDPIAKLIRVNDGQYPQDNDWPFANQNELESATGNRIHPLLVFYGLPVTGSLVERKGRLKMHLGVVL
eukprot:scaffold8371_cov199-Amphora_coffeaeformis.AAC.1